jgi:hypothetical protein
VEVHVRDWLRGLGAWEWAISSIEE